MNIITMFFLALGLSADAFTVSVTNGICYKDINEGRKFFSACCFGLSQGLMPCMGYYFGNMCQKFITFFDRWLILIILCFLGINMIFSTLKEKKKPDCSISPKIFSYNLIFMQTIATSIDALSVGIALATENVNIISCAFIIAVVTFGLCQIGLKIGEKFGNFLKDKAEITGGIILILIGIKLFLEK